MFFITKLRLCTYLKLLYLKSAWLLLLGVLHPDWLSAIVCISSMRSTLCCLACCGCCGRDMDCGSWTGADLLREWFTTGCGPPTFWFIDGGWKNESGKLRLLQPLCLCGFGFCTTLKRSSRAESEFSRTCRVWFPCVSVRKLPATTFCWCWDILDSTFRPFDGGQEHKLWYYNIP